MAETVGFGSGPEASDAHVPSMSCQEESGSCDASDVVFIHPLSPNILVQHADFYHHTISRKIPYSSHVNTSNTTVPWKSVIQVHVQKNGQELMKTI